MADPTNSAWESQRASIGASIRAQRMLANMSLRELSRATQVSNAYLSQIERGLNDPTLRVLVQIGDALELSVQEMLHRGGGLSGSSSEREPSAGMEVEAAIRADQQLTEPEKAALRAVYRSYLGSHARGAAAADP